MLTVAERADLKLRIAAIDALKGKNPEDAFFVEWSDHWISDALVYGDLTPGCTATLRRVQADRFEWRKPASLTLSWQRKGVWIAAITAIAAIIAPAML